MKEKFDVGGMSCAACSAAVEREVKGLDGVDEVSVNLLANSMNVSYDENKLSSVKIEEAVAKAGYTAHRKGEKTKSTSNKEIDLGEKEIKNMKSRLFISFSFLIPLMYVAMAHMFNLPELGFLKGHNNAVSFAFTQFLLVLPIAYVNRKYYINGFKSLYRRNPNMDSLIAMGSTAAIVFGIYVIYKLSYALGIGDIDIIHKYYHNLYFESGGMILTLITLGKYFESLSKGKTKDSVKKLMDLSPKTAIIEVDGKEVEIATDEIKKGDILVIKPGARVAVDGKIIEGFAMFDTSAITGESLAVEKIVGDNLLTSSILKQGSVRMVAEKVGEETTLSQIINLVEEANATKPQIAKLADKIAGIFVPSVIGIALVVFIAWILLGKEFEFALEMAISVLVISCPCALGLATPVAIMVSTGKGAREGLLIKSSEALENLDKVDTVVFDKTGTLTEGRPVVTDLISTFMDKGELLDLFYSLESKSEHPLASAICDYSKKEKANMLKLDSFINKIGLGIKGEIRGITYTCGNLKMLEEKTELGEDIKEVYEKLSAEGKTVVFLSKENTLLGLCAMQDKIKDTSLNAIKHLKEKNIKTVMLTGDNKRVARTIANRLALDEFYAEMFPQDKERIVRELINKGRHVAMVGDGINDSPALAGANVGIAVASGTDIAIEAADVVLIKNDMTDIVNLINLAKKTIVNIKENLFWAFIYNILCIPLAAGVFYKPFGLALNPMIGSLAMSFSSVFVVSNALRINNFRKLDSLKKRDQRNEEILNEVNFSVFENKIKSNSININKEKGDFRMKKTMIIEGMMCGHCKARVEKILNELEGIKALVNLEEKFAEIEMTKEYSNDELKKIVEEAGYQVLEVR